MNNSRWSIVNSRWFSNLLKSGLLWAMVYCLWSNNSFSAIPTYIKTIEKKPISIFVNTTNDIFLLYKGMLERYNADGTFFQNYGSIYINEHTEIISITGFKTILYSPDFGKIIQLDNRFKEIDVIDVFNLGTYLITCVGTSYDNNFLWLWDDATQRLIKMDKDQKPIFESNNLSLWTGKTIHPIQITEVGIQLFVLDTTQGIFIFDNQGNFIKNIPIYAIQDLKIYENQLFYYKEQCIYSYQQLTFSEIKYTQTPKLENIQLGKSILCGINQMGWVEIWKY